MPHGPTRSRGDERLARRLSHPVRQPAQTLTSSIAPALITCWRCRGFTSECAREGAARHDLLRRHRRSSSTFPAHRRPLPRAGSSTTIKRSSSSGPTRRRQLWILPDRTRRRSRTVLAALVVHLTPALNATRRAALPPSDVPRHAGSPLALPQRHPPPRRMRRPYRAMPHALPSAAQVGRAVSAVEEEGGSLRAGPATSCFLHCVWETGIVLRGIWEAFAPPVDL